MRVLFVRHADPDYEHDSLTYTGDYEASLLADRLCRMDIKAFYCSPQGRAQRTASFTLNRLGRTAVTYDWLHEFLGRCEKPNLPGELSISWDWLPQDWTGRPMMYDKDNWFNDSAYDGTNVREEALKVCNGIDSLLSEHGYVREGNIYKVEKPSNDTIVIFCHFGVTGVMLGHILGISPMVVLHNMCALPSSVTTIVTEERAKGIASFRMLEFGSVDHLYARGQNPSFAARFCECCSNADERH